MTTNRNDHKNWLVVCEELDGTLQVVGAEQAENVARQRAEDYAQGNHDVTVFVYERKGCIRTVPVARWQ